MNELRLNFSKMLRALVEKRDYTQLKIAELVGVEPSNVSNWINGHNFPDRQNYVTLCRILGVETDYFSHMITPEEHDEINHMRTENAYLKSKIARLEASIESVDAGIWLALQDATDATIRNVKIALGLIKPSANGKSKKSHS